MDQKNYIVIPGLEHSSPAEQTPLQKAIYPYVADIELFWSAVWMVTLCYLLYRYILYPLMQKFFAKS